MKELREIVAAAQAILGQGQACALATVVRVQGSSYRKPGARMLMGREGRVAGCVSGGCLEADVVEWGRRVMARGTPRLLTYDTLTEDAGAFGPGTDLAGIVEILVENLVAGREHALSALRLDRMGVLATVYRCDVSDHLGTRVWVEEGTTVSGPLADAARSAFRLQASRHTELQTSQGRLEVFCEFIEPSPTLLVCGAGPDAIPLVRLAAEIGWRTVVVDHREATLDASLFPTAERLIAAQPETLLEHFIPDGRTAVVVMTHNYLLDLQLLIRVASTPAFYVGLLGSRQRMHNLRRELQSGDGDTVARLGGRLHAPVGLDIGATTPEAIALSIVAEIHATRAGRAGGSFPSTLTAAAEQPLLPSTAGDTSLLARSLCQRGRPRMG